MEDSSKAEKPASREDGDRSGKKARRPILRGLSYAGVGVGIALTGVMTGFLVRGEAADKEVDNTLSVAERQPILSRGYTANSVAIATGLGGGVLVAAGVVGLVLTAKRRSRPAGERRLSVTPWGGRTQAGLALGGRF